MTIDLSTETVARLEEMMSRLNERRSRPPMTLEQVVEWALLRQYNRTRAVRRYALALKDIDLEISPLERRDQARKHDDD